MRFEIVRIDVPDFAELGQRRLNLAEIIGRAGHKHSLFSAPIPTKPKPGMRFWKNRPLEFRVLPGSTVVGGYFDPADGASTGPSQTGDLVESLAPHPMSAGRTGDYRIHSQLESEPALFVVGIFALLHSTGVEEFPLCEGGPVHDVDSPQPLHVVDSFIAGRY